MKRYIPYLFAFSFCCLRCHQTGSRRELFAKQGRYRYRHQDRKRIAFKIFLRQKPNSSVPVFGRVRLHLYNLAGNDSTWMNRQLRKWGEPPVLYSDRLTAISTEQIRLELNNRGYLNAKVDTFVVKENKKADVTYDVTGYEPYRIFRYSNALGSVDTAIHHVLSEENLDFVKEGDIFDRRFWKKGEWIWLKPLEIEVILIFRKTIFIF